MSTQEELFASQRWAELLEMVMLEESGTAVGAGEGASNSSRKGFRMSCNEWQAFLGILEAGSTGHQNGPHNRRELSPAELRQAGSAPCTISNALSASQLHCPLALLAVHAFALWSGAIHHTTFLSSLNRLEELVAIHEDGVATEQLERRPGDEGDASPDAAAKEHGEGADRRAERLGMTEERESSDEEDYYDDSDDGKEEDARLRPPLAQEPLTEAPVEPREHSAPEASEHPPTKTREASGRDGCAERGGAGRDRRQLFLMAEYAKLACLFRNLGNELISIEGEASGGGGEGAAPFSSADSPKMRAAFRQLKSTNVTDRPVARVSLSVSLAIYAALAPTPLYAEEGVAQLRRLNDAMHVRGGRGEGQQQQPAAPRPRGYPDDNEGNDGSDVNANLVERGEASHHSHEPVTEQWPWVTSLERVLIHRQHELDVQQCLGESGVQLARDLQTLRRNRRTAEVVDSDDTGGGTGGGEAAKRWDLCQSQYVGQRHIWAPLMTAFLSADVFESDKATVMVFFGPSGYGKSALAKQVASAVHGCPVNDLEASGKMVYIHMPSFTTKESVYSLVDPPAAHVGDGILLSALLRHPDAVVVLDEFDKSTAEAVQHLWLSAFQRHGVLRSLKRADRSVSTVKTTFVLTCNIGADVMEREADAYLAASPTQQGQMRRRYEEMCKEICRVRWGDPFANRVDHFYAFTPYSRVERQDYVELTLERLLAAQRDKGRRVYVTPRCIAALVSDIKTFHASTIEDVLRPLLVSMSQRKWAEAVFTVESHAVARDGHGHSAYVFLPCSNADPADGNTDVWERLSGGAECLRLWRDIEGSDERAEEEAAAPPPPPPLVKDRPHTPVAQSVDGRAPSKPVTMERERELERKRQEEVATEVLTERELALTKELELAKALLLKKEKEIATLKERLAMLEKLLAVVTCVMLCCIVTIYLLVGWKLTLLLVASLLGVVTLVLEIPLWTLVHALAAFCRFLGPGKTAVVVLLMSLWVFQASKRLRCDA